MPDGATLFFKVVSQLLIVAAGVSAIYSDLYKVHLETRRRMPTKSGWIHMCMLLAGLCVFIITETADHQKSSEQAQTQKDQIKSLTQVKESLQKQVLSLDRVQSNQFATIKDQRRVLDQQEQLGSQQRHLIDTQLTQFAALQDITLAQLPVGAIKVTMPIDAYLESLADKPGGAFWEQPVFKDLRQLSQCIQNSVHGHPEYHTTFVFDPSVDNQTERIVCRTNGGSGNYGAWSAELQETVQSNIKELLNYGDGAPLVMMIGDRKLFSLSQANRVEATKGFVSAVFNQPRLTYGDVSNQTFRLAEAYYSVQVRQFARENGFRHYLPRSVRLDSLDPNCHFSLAFRLVEKHDEIRAANGDKYYALSEPVRIKPPACEFLSAERTR